MALAPVEDWRDALSRNEDSEHVQFRAILPLFKLPQAHLQVQISLMLAASVTVALA